MRIFPQKKKTNVTLKPPKGKQNKHLDIEETDRKILKILTADSRLSYREVARHTGLSVKTIIDHIRKLETNGLIKGYHVAVDTKKLGYGLTALIEVAVSRGLLTKAMDELAKLPNVHCVYETTGPEDTFIIARFRDSDDLHDFILDLQKKPFVERTETMVVLKTVKEDFRFLF